MGKKMFGFRIAFMFAVISGILFLPGLYSCSTVATGIEHARLEVQAKMSNTIFLNPVRPDQKTIFVEFRNTSQVSMPDLKRMIISRLEQKGYRVVNDPYKAEFWLQGNVLYIGKASRHMTMAGMLAGGYGGALAGSTMGGSWRGTAGAIGAGAVAGSLAGAVVGAVIHVDTYIGVVDIQIKQRVNGTIQEQVNSNLQNGIGTENKTNYKTTTQYQAFRTRIGVEATQTNLNLKKAIPVIEDKLAKEIVGLFD